jgi:putative flippase GtrA
MKELIEKYFNKATIIQFIKFGIVGLSNTVIAYITYVILVYIGLYYIFANIIAFIISVLNSFYWNNKYVFKNNAKSKLDIFKSLIKTFISYAFSGIVIGNLLLFIFVDILHISKYIAPFFGLVISVPLNFILNKLWAFRPVKNKNEKIDVLTSCRNGDEGIVSTSEPNSNF